MRMLARRIHTTTSRAALGSAYSGAGVLGICLLAVVFFASCRKQASTNPKSSSRPTIGTVEPFFRVPGFSDKIDSDYGLPLQGLVATSVKYDLGVRFPPTDFLAALDGHLRKLGWSSPQFTFSNPPEPAAEAATWRNLPTAKIPVRMLEQWWVRADEVLCVTGQHFPGPAGGDATPGNVYVVIARYHAAEAARKLSEYEELNGTLPTAQADAQARRASDSAATAEDP